MKMIIFSILLFTIFCAGITAQTKPRARDLGVPFDGNTIYALPHARLKAALKRYNRLMEPAKK